MRLAVTREAEQDAMTLSAECANAAAGLSDAVAETLQSVTKLKGAVKLVAPGSLPNDGKVIADERPVRACSVSVYFAAIRPSTPVRAVPSLRRYSTTSFTISGASLSGVMRFASRNMV